MTYLDAIESALSALSERQRYARDVILGAQRWSGSDLKGKARRFGASYARQRGKALQAWKSAGGSTVALRRSGLIVSAVLIGQDDYGRGLYDAGRLGVLVATVDTR